MKSILLMLVILVIGGRMQAQTVIEGTVTDSLGQAVDAYVTVSPKGCGGHGHRQCGAGGGEQVAEG